MKLATCTSYRRIGGYFFNLNLIIFMGDKDMHTVNVDFGGNLQMTFKLTEWEKKRLEELKNQGVNIHQAISQVKNELRAIGLNKKE